MTRVRLATLLCLALLVPAGSVQARAEPTRPVVASLPGVELRAYDGKGSFCVELGKAGEPGGASSCGPSLKRDPFQYSRAVSNVYGVPAAIGGAVPAGVARVEVVATASEPASVATVPGEAYRGRQAGRVRFFLAPLKKGVKALEVRSFAADGTLLAVDDVVDGRRPPVAGPVRIGTLRDGRRRLAVQADVTERLAPNLADPGHHDRQTCVSIRARGAVTIEGHDDDDERSRGCLYSDLGVGSPDLQSSCDPARSYLSGIYAAGERSATVVLGSGRRLRARDFRLPLVLGGGRAWAAVVPGAEAIRRVEVAGGESLAFERPPAEPRCRAHLGGFFAIAFYGPASGGHFGPELAPDGPFRPAAGADPATLEAADSPQNGLCLRFGTARRVRVSDCLPVSRGEDGRTLTERTANGDLAVGGVTPRAAAWATVTFTDGSAMTAPVGPAPPGGYAGAYRGKVAFYALTAPAGAVVSVVTLRSATGRILSAEDLQAPEGRVSRVRRLVGDPPLYTARLRYRTLGARTVVSECIATRRPRDGSRCLPVDPRSRQAQLTVGCAPRATTVLGHLRAGDRSVSLELRDGTRRRAALRPRHFFAIRLRPREALRAVTVATRRGKVRDELRLPPAAEQCGYDDFVDLYARP